MNPQTKQPIVSEEDVDAVLAFIEQKKMQISELGFKITKILSKARDIKAIRDIKAKISVIKK